MSTGLFIIAESLIPKSPLSEMEVAFRLGVAVVFAMVIGMERDKADKPADARTMALISASAAGFTLLGVQLAASLPEGTANINLDPTRVISYIISGVGFLGAGAILHSKRSVKGLTTAASIWTAAAIGAASGLGAYTIATMLFLVAFIMLWGPWIRTRLVNGRADKPAEPSAERGTPKANDPTDPVSADS